MQLRSLTLRHDLVAARPSSGAHPFILLVQILFGIASNSKAFTAASVAQLVDQGKLNWTSRATAVIPGLGFADEFANKQATLKDILSHRSGLPRHDHSYRLGTTFADFVARIEHLRPSAEFREEWQ